MKSNIVLIGFMGTGKTTIGKILAEMLKKELIEMDDLIVEKAGKSIPDIFSEDGEIVFREFEMAVSKDLSEAKNCIISAGGGVILNKLNIDYLKKNADIVLLQATAKEIFDRISLEGKEKRPLLNKPDPMGEIRSLLRFRRPFYEAHADYKISTYNKIPTQIAEEVIATIKEEKNQTIGGGDLKDIFNEISNVFDNDSAENEPISIDAGTFILTECLKWNKLDVLGLVSKLLGEPIIINDKSALKGLIPGVFLVLIKNYIERNNIKKITIKNDEGKSEEIDIDKIDSSKIGVAIKRGMMIPYGSCSFFGISEFVLGIGIATSVFLGATPKSILKTSLSNKATLFAFKDLIARNQLKNCEESDIIESVIISGIKFYSEKFGFKFIQ